MRLNPVLFCASLSVAALFATSSAIAAIVVPGADGTDSIFNPNASVTIDLSQAATGAWDSPSPAAGKGVYDPEKWAVVFKYQRVVIREGVTITFKNHPSGAPVVWLVTEGVGIDGSIQLDGQIGHHHVNDTKRLSTPGPGGFPGGFGAVNTLLGNGGFGVAGGYDPGFIGSANSFYDTNSGGYATTGLQRPNESRPVTYGNAKLLPLIGGSGGAGAQLIAENGGGGGGGAGGGAILIAAQGAIEIDGQISARGGKGGTGGGGGNPGTADGGAGSGGAIKLIADSLSGSGELRADPGVNFHGVFGNLLRRGGDGRIRLEVNSSTFAHPGSPVYTSGMPGQTAELWPDPGAPVVRLITLSGVPVPAHPIANLIDFAQADVPVTTEDFAQLVLETENVDDQASVLVRVTPIVGTNDDYPAFHISTADGVSTWHADLPLGQGFSAIQVRVVTQ